MTGDALHFFYSVSLKLRYCATHTECGSYGSEDCRCQVPQKLNKPRFVLLSHTFVLHNFIVHNLLGTVEKAVSIRA